MGDPICRGGNGESGCGGNGGVVSLCGSGRPAAEGDGGGSGRRQVDESRRLDTFVVISQGAAVAESDMGDADGNAERRGGEGYLPTSCPAVSKEYLSTSNRSLQIDGE